MCWPPSSKIVEAEEAVGCGVLADEIVDFEIADSEIADPGVVADCSPRQLGPCDVSEVVVDSVFR